MTIKKPAKAKVAKKKHGRPPLYTKELAERVCYLVELNNMSLDRLCAKYPELPHRDTIQEWRRNDAGKDSFSAMYTLAKQRQIENVTENLAEMCEVETHIDKDAIERVDSGKVQLQRLKVDTQKWLAAKLAPKIYGDQKRIDSLESDNDKMRSELTELRKKLDVKNEKEY